MAKSSSFKGSVTFYSSGDSALMLKVQYENRSTLINNTEAKKRINANIDRINEYINSLNP